MKINSIYILLSMSQSLLFKHIISKKIQTKYVFILYKQLYNNSSSAIIPLEICNNNYQTLVLILQYYINELRKTKTIISPYLYKLLNSKKSIQRKINAIVFEYKNLFDPNNSSDYYYNINEFKFQLVKLDNISYYDIIKEQLIHNKYFINHTLHDYNYFYKSYRFNNL